jgi:hypothetical protein
VVFGRRRARFEEQRAIENAILRVEVSRGRDLDLVGACVSKKKEEPGAEREL